MKIALWSAQFSELKENRVDHTFWLHLQKNKQKMKTGWTTHSWNKAIWLALSLCHMTMTRKINKLEKPGRPQGNFHALFGRSAAFYGHFERTLWRQSGPPAYHHQWMISVLNLSWRRYLFYRNQSIDLQNKSMDWFLCIQISKEDACN